MQRRFSMLNTLLPINARPSALNQISRDVDRLFEMTMGLTPRTGQSWPGINAWQDGDDYVLEAEVPGYGIDDIQIDVNQNTITIRGQRERSTPADAITIRTERSVSRFERTFRFPAAIDHDQIDASLSNGVLQVRVPISESARPKRIEIRQGETKRIENKKQNALPDGSNGRQPEQDSPDDSSES